MALTGKILIPLAVAGVGSSLVVSDLVPISVTRSQVDSLAIARAENDSAELPPEIFDEVLPYDPASEQEIDFSTFIPVEAEGGFDVPAVTLEHSEEQAVQADPVGASFPVVPVFVLRSSVSNWSEY